LELNEDIFLIDHLWTFRSEAEAKTQLEANPQLVDRLASLFDLQDEGEEGTPEEGVVR